MIQHAVAPPTTLTAAAPTAAPSLRTKPNVMILKLGVLVPNLYIRGINILNIDTRIRKQFEIEITQLPQQRKKLDDLQIEKP
jgi:hypothetical protein